MKRGRRGADIAKLRLKGAEVERRGEEDEADGEGEGGGDEEVSRVESGDAHHPQGIKGGGRGLGTTCHHTAVFDDSKMHSLFLEVESVSTVG